MKPDLFLQFAEWIKGNEHSLSDFIEFLNLGTEADSYIQKSESVALMTIHASKGLEFKCVFIRKMIAKMKVNVKLKLWKLGSITKVPILA